MDKSRFISRHLSALIMIAIYLFIVIFHILSDSFLLDRQLDLAMVMVPFILYGLILDFAMSRTNDLDPFYQIIGKILPVGVFIIEIINTIILYQGNQSSDLLSMTIWIFLALPFFITSYNKVNFRTDIIRSLAISTVILIIYGYLSTQTDTLNTGSGIILYYITYVLIFYVVSQFRLFPYSAILLGAVIAVVLLSFRFLPMTQETKLYGWDYNLLFRFELLLVVTLVVAILLRLLSILRSKNE